MEVIKLGDKLTIPGKNIQGEVAFIGEPYFSDGTWFGIILDNPTGKHNGTVDGIRYFNCPRNHGMFIRASYFEKQCVINSATNKHRSLIPKSIKYPNYLKANSKHNTEDTSCASNSISNRKVKRKSQDENRQIKCGDNVTNTNEKNAKLAAITECGDNINASDMKKIPFLRRYPNYLKASSKLGSHFCCNKSNNDKTSQDTTDDDRVAHINDKNLALSLVDKNKETPDKDDDSPKKRIIYPNYLKASSKLTEKHLCAGKSSDVNKTEYEITNSGGIKDSSEKSVQAKTRKESADNNNNSDNSVSKGIKCLHHRKTFSKGNRPCLAKSIEMSQAKSLSENENHEILKNNDIHQDIHEKSVELETMKRENEVLKNKLKSQEVSLQEALSKYDKAQEEIKHLKYDNDCQRKQIKFQKNHLNLLKMKHNNHFKKPDCFDKKSYQIKIDQFLESTLNENRNNDVKASSEKPDLESVKVMAMKHRILELEEQNRVMMQGLVELRDVLKMQCKSQSIGLGSLNSVSYGHFYNRRSRKITSSNSFGTPIILKPEEFTPEESTAQLNENTEMLREMIKYNEIMKEKERWLKDYEATSLEKELSGDINLSDEQHDSDNFMYTAVESTLNFSLESECNIKIESHRVLSNDKMDCEAFQNSSVLKENDIQNNYETAISRNSQHFPNITTMINGKIYKHQVGDRASLESTDSIEKLGNQPSTKEPISNEDTSQSNSALNEQDILEKEVLDCAENLNARESGTLPRVFPDVPSQPTGKHIRSSGDSPMKLAKPKQFKSKMFQPCSTELRKSQEMGSMNK